MIQSWDFKLSKKLDLREENWESEKHTNEAQLRLTAMRSLPPHPSIIKVFSQLLNFGSSLKWNPGLPTSMLIHMGFVFCISYHS